MDTSNKSLNIKSLSEYISSGMILLNGATVSYHEGNIVGTWFGQHVSIDALQLSSEDIHRYGIEEAIYRLLAENAPISQEEYRRFGHKTLNLEGKLSHWVSRADRVYPVLTYESHWNIEKTPTPDDFTVTWEEGIVCIESNTDRHIPHESIAYGIDFLQSVLKEDFLITPDTSIAVFEQATRAVLIGHHKFIERLCIHTAHNCRPYFAFDLDTVVR